jgi:broad specificity phosphatase PhoE
MGLLTLVRHGQASLGAADYDQLSELGTRQCTRLGEYFRQRGRRFGAVLRGSLKRHEQSLQALQQAYGDLPPAMVFPQLNEYDSEAVLRAVYPGELLDVHSAEGRRQHFRLLRDGLLAWVEGRSAPTGMPSHADFVAGIRGVLDQVRQQFDGEVLLVSSGGPISAAVVDITGMPPQGMIELNLRMRNSALTEFIFNARRHSLERFNHLPHLDSAEHASWETFA